MPIREGTPMRRTRPLGARRKKDLQAHRVMGPVAVRAAAVRALAAGAFAVGSFAGGLVSLGLVQVGWIVIGRADVRRLRIGRLEGGELTVTRSTGAPVGARSPVG